MVGPEEPAVREGKFGMNRFARLMALLVPFAAMACAEEVKPIAQPEGGYDAVRFVRTVEVSDHAIGSFVFNADSVFISDRLSDRGKVYCGTVTYNSAAWPTCIRAEPPNTIFVQVGMRWTERAREVPPGTFELTKVKM